MIGHQLTKEDIAAMEAEIDHRKQVERPKLIEAVKEARAQGDLSENFEYYAAKRAKNQNESRIRYLDKQIRFATIIEDDSGDDEVGIGDDVTIYFEDEDVEETYTLLTTMGADSLNNKISIESPIGIAVRGKKIGDRCEVHINKNVSFFVKISDIVKH